MVASGIPKSLRNAVRHAGIENQRSGKKAIAARIRNAKRALFVTEPSERRGGRTRSKKPSNATTIPSAHFSVAPPRKQASTGNSAVVALLIERVAAEFWRRCDSDRGMELRMTKGRRR